MRSYPANDKILMRMLSYGMVSGAIAGGIITCATSLLHSYGLLASVLHALSLGLISGVVFGCIVGLINGFIMAMIVPRALTSQNTDLVRIGLGLTTTCIALIVSPIFAIAMTVIELRLEPNVHVAMLCVLATLSIFACQQTITQYIRETGLRKSKKFT